MAFGKEVADAYISIHGNLAPFRKDLALAEGYLQSFGQKMRGLAGLNVLEDTFRFGIRFMQNIDREAVKLAQWATLVGTVMAASVQLIGAMATISQDLAAMVGIGILAPGFLTGFGIALGVSIAAFKDMKTVLADLAPAFSRLQNTISTKFWEQAAQPIRNLTNALLPTLQRELGNTATAMGSLFGELAKAFQKEASPERVSVMFQRLNSAIDIARAGIAPFTRAMVNLGEVGSKSFERFATWMVKLSEQFDNFVTRSINNGDMDRWIENAIDGFKNVGRSIDGAIGIVNALGNAFREAGGGGLAEFANRLQGASDIMNGERFQNALVNLFTGANAAMAGLYSGLGRLGPAFEDLGPTFVSVGGTIGSILDQIGVMLARVFMNDTLQTGFRNFMSDVNTALRSLGPAVDPFAASLGQLLNLMGEVLKSVAIIGGEIISKWGPVFDQMQAQLETMVQPLQHALSTVIDVLTPALQSFSDNVLTPVVTIIRDSLLPAVEDIAKAVGPSLTVVFETLGDFLRNDLSPAFQQFRDDMHNAGAEGPTFAAQLQDAIKNIENFLNAASNPLPPGVGLFGDKTAIEGFNASINQAIANFWASVGAWIDGLNTTVNTSIATFWAGIGAFFVEGFAKLGAQWNQFWSDLGTSIGSLNETVNATLAAFWEGIGAGLASFAAGFTASWNAFWLGLGTMIQGIWDGIVAILNGAWAGLLLGVQTFITAWNQFWTAFWLNLSAPVQQALTTAWTYVTTGVALIGATITTSLAAISAGWNATWSAVSSFITTTWASVTNTVNGAVKNLQSYIQAGLQNISSAWNNIWSQVSNYVNTAWSQISNYVQSGISRAQQVVQAGLQNISSAWNNIWSQVSNYASSVWNSITSYINNGINQARNVVSMGLSNISNAFQNAWNQVTNGVANAWNQITSGVSNGVNTAINMVGRLPGALGAMAGQMVSAGINMMAGFANGVASMAGRIIQSAVNAVGGAIQAVRNLLNLGSPSKLFRQFGEWTGEGLAIGMDNMQGMIAKTAQTMADAATKAFSGTSMFKQGANAAESLAEGMKSNASKLSDIVAEMTPTMTAKFNAMGALPSAASATAETSSSKTIIFQEGAFALTTPVKDPAIVASMVIDEFANNSTF